uniref:BETA-1,4-XYLOGLUCAN HYDROLASE n=1 Tax=Acetivibrio thermocellus TaxID=1515 RepID=UPI0000D7DE9C|nr:Chain A, BETA-1,4-XYLOGLUCAN HYDROLASE [Acetivibrio thermocellus]2CN3_B Chain B, BETA-1,4-XYLOGLUCAN HYDROLASE [Acetivibrio thermocellus]
ISSQAVTSVPYKWDNVVIGGGGGFMPGIVFNETEKDLIYARAAIGGAYRWDPSTETWIPLLDHFQMDEYSYYGVESIATDPVDPNRVYIVAGMYTNDWLPNMGAILRSTDRGETWEKTILPFKMGGNMPGRSMGERLAIDPNDNRILYLGTRCGNGLWRSTDYGVTWSKVESFPNPGTYIYDPNFDYTKDIIGVVWVVFDKSSSTPGNPTKTIYVGVADKNESIYRSTDGGVTWKAVPGQPKGLLPHHGVLASNGMLYITYGDTCGPYDGNGKGQVWKFNTRTGEWIDITPIPYSSSDNRFCFAGLAVDRQNPDIIMVTSMNAWWPDEYIFRSTDGGATWKNIWEWGMYPERILHYEIDISAAPWLDWGTEKQLPEINPKLGWMIGDIEIDPFNSDRMMYVTGATIYGCDNLTDWDRGGKVKIEVKATGIEECAVLDLVSPPEGAPLVSAVGDLVGFVHDDLKVGPKKMHVPSYSSGTGIDYAELVPNFMALVAKADLYDVKKISFSYDGGRNWFQPPNEAPNSVGGGSVAVAADAKSVIWTPENASPAVTTDNGNSWKVCTNLGMGAVVASDRVNGKKFYAFYNGKFYISTDGGLTFTDTKAPQLPKSVNKIKAVPGKEGHVWLAAREGGLWRSTDGGYTFEKLSNVDTAHVVGFGKAAPGQDYMAIYITGKIDNVLGFFRSDDAGKTWVRINDDEHGYGAVDTAITGDPRVYGRVYIATNGRGIVYGEPASDEPV